MNASSGLTALWILLCCIGYMLLLLYAIKPCLMWLLRRAGSIENGPSQSIIALILLLALTSAFFTGIIGVHAIFGGFMVGLIIPREGGFNIKVTEKLEDLIGAIFLPLYFTLSGLNTNLGLLDTGMAWAYVIAITVVAFVSKVIGASLAAKSNGLVWRESFTIGILMSCKGLVELIVLVCPISTLPLSHRRYCGRQGRRLMLTGQKNIGLQARILSQRTFTIFVVMALLTTFATTPIASALYPPWYQKKLAAWKRGEIDWDTGEPIEGSDGPGEPGNVTGDRIRRLFVYLRLDNMPAILGLVSLFGLPPNSESRAPPADNAEGGKEKDAAALVSAGGVRAVRVHGIRLIQLTDRDSSVMTVSQVDEYSHFDPVVNIFRSLGQFSRLAVSGEVAVMPESRFSETIVTRSSDMSSDLTLIPWSETGSMGDAQVLSSEVVNKKLTLPYINFVKSVLDDSERNVAVFFNGYDAVLADSERPDLPKLTRAYSFSDRHRDIPNAAVTTMAHHFFLPYFGGIDDRLALTIVLQLCEKPDVTATVIQMPGSDEGHDDYFALASSKVPSSVASRVSFETETVENDAEAVLARAMSEFEASSRETARQNLVVLGRRSNHKEPDGKAPVSVVDEITECLGATAGHLIAAKAKVGLLVVQAKASRD